MRQELKGACGPDTNFICYFFFHFSWLLTFDVCLRLETKFLQAVKTSNVYDAWFS